MVAGVLSLSLLMALNYRLIFHPGHDGWQVPFSEHTMVTAPHELKLTQQTSLGLGLYMAAGLDHHQQQLEWLRRRRRI